MKIDNFALTMFQVCPAKYFLRMKQNWDSRRKSAALGFGGALHLGLAEWHRTHDRAAALLAIDAGWPDNLPPEDWRTKEKCLSVMVDYMRQYPVEAFKMISAPEYPLVEEHFTLPTGLYLDCAECGPGGEDNADPACANCGGQREEIEYGGIFDGGITFDIVGYVFEHKTTTMFGKPPHAWFFQQFKPNNQVTGYVWALRKMTNLKIDGAIINGIGLYKAGPTKFKREITTRSDEDIQNWLLNLRNSCQAIADCERRGYFPMHTQSCMMYGKCTFHDVHVIGNPKEQEKYLDMMYVKSPWDYEHRDDDTTEASDA